MSALSLKADIPERATDVSFVPAADIKRGNLTWRGNHLHSTVGGSIPVSDRLGRQQTNNLFDW